MVRRMQAFRVVGPVAAAGQRVADRAEHVLHEEATVAGNFRPGALAFRHPTGTPVVVVVAPERRSGTAIQASLPAGVERRSCKTQTLSSRLELQDFGVIRFGGGRMSCPVSAAGPGASVAARPGLSGFSGLTRGLSHHEGDWSECTHISSATPTLPMRVPRSSAECTSSLATSSSSE